MVKPRKCWYNEEQCCPQEYNNRMHRRDFCTIVMCKVRHSVHEREEVLDQLFSLIYCFGDVSFGSFVDLLQEELKIPSGTPSRR